MTQNEIETVISCAFHSKGTNLTLNPKSRKKSVPATPGKQANIDKLTDLEDLLRINSELGMRRDLKKALQLYVTRAAGFMRFHRAFLGIVEDGKCMVRYAVNKGKPTPFNFALDRGMTFDVIRRKKPFVTENIGKERNVNMEMVKKFNVTQYMAVPVITLSGSVFGVIGLLDKIDGEKITKQDIERAKDARGGSGFGAAIRTAFV